MVASSRIRLRSLDVNGRHDLLAETTGLDKNTLQALRPEHGLTVEQADHMIENAVGIMGIPVGIACNFVINGARRSGADGDRRALGAIAAGATRAELPGVVARLIKDGAVRHDHAERVLNELRSSKLADQDQS